MVVHWAGRMVGLSVAWADWTAVQKVDQMVGQTVSLKAVLRAAQMAAPTAAPMAAAKAVQLGY